LQAHQVGQLLETVQSDYILHLGVQLVQVNQANHQQELEHLLFQLLVPQRVVQLQLDCTHPQEQQLQMERQASLQHDLSFHQEVLPVQEMAIHLFPPFTRILELLQLVVLEHQTTQSFIRTLEPLKVQVPQLQVTLH
jgi:hypothetical protein